MKSISIPFILALILAGGCASVQSSWQAAESANTVEAYEGFLRQYPESELTEQARGRIAGLRLEEAQSEDTIVAYEEFIAQYEGSELTEHAQARIEILFDSLRSTRISGVVVDQRIVSYGRKHVELPFEEVSRSFVEYAGSPGEGDTKKSGLILEIRAAGTAVAVTRGRTGILWMGQAGHRSEWEEYNRHGTTRFRQKEGVDTLDYAKAKVELAGERPDSFILTSVSGEIAIKSRGKDFVKREFEAAVPLTDAALFTGRRPEEKFVKSVELGTMIDPETFIQMGYSKDYYQWQPADPNDLIATRLTELFCSSFGVELGQLIHELYGVAPLVSALNDALFEMRASAALALGQSGDYQAVEQLIGTVEGDNHPNVRTSAAQALKEITKVDFGTNAAGWMVWWANNKANYGIE